MSNAIKQTTFTCSDHPSAALLNAVDFDNNTCVLDLDAERLAQTDGGLHRNVLKTDLISVQPKRLQFGEIHHVYDAAETTQGELCSHSIEKTIRFIFSAKLHRHRKF